MGVTVNNVKIVQCTIFRWNPWTTNWIKHVWNGGAANFGTRCISSQFTLCSEKPPKNHENPLFKSSKSFKVIDGDIPKKLVDSSCYDKQHVCAYLQPFSC